MNINAIDTPSAIEFLKTNASKIIQYSESTVGLDELFDILEDCRGIEQMDKYHPEGDVFNHSIQVLHWALKESYDKQLILAAMLHDVGKQIHSLRHEQYSIEITCGLISAKTTWLIKNHMRFWTMILGETRKRQKVLDLVGHQWFQDLALLCRWDKLGRDPKKKVIYDREQLIDRISNL